MTDTDAWLDATAQAELVARGDVSPAELVDAAIARIEALNPALNAVIHERFERARAEARADSDRPPGRTAARCAVPREGRRVPHRGRPVPLRHAVAQAPAVDRARRHVARGALPRGRAVFVGKTNTPELATSVTTEPLAYGATHNPWDLDAFAGRFERRRRGRGRRRHGARSRTATTWAARSGFPASMCGIVGLKPTRARTTLGPDFGEYWGPLTHEHVLTRSVRDTALVLDAVAGAGPAIRTPRRRRRARSATRSERRRAGCGSGCAPGGATASRARPTACARSSAPAGCSSRSGITSRRVDLPALDDPVDDAFGTVMTVAVAARPRALEPNARA